MAQPPSERASAQPTLTPLPSAASVRVAHVAVRTGGHASTTKQANATDQRDKRKAAERGDAFASDVILVTSEDLRLFAEAEGRNASNNQQDDASGRAQLPAIEFN